jgi:phosphatidylserine/phosphatidylglycerophosphate/cardiolipin synthase-like enzyme
MKLRTKIRLILLLLIILVILNWSTIAEFIKEMRSSDATGMATGSSGEEKTAEEKTAKPEVYFCPADNCMNELLLWMDAAEKTIHCAFFEVELEELKEKLAERKKQGIDVRIVTDNNYFDQAKEFNFVKADNRSGLMHNKFCVLDEKAVWTGSFNPTFRDNYKNNNNVVFYQSKLLAESYETEFLEMWNGTFGKGERNKKNKFIINGRQVEAYFCPEDWCANKAIYTLQEANKSVYFMTFSFTHDEIGKQILALAKEGIDVKGVFEKSQRNDFTEKINLENAKLENVKVRWDGNPANMHHKVFIIDNETVVTGSFNPTSNGDSNNDENLIIIHDPDVASLFVEEFWKVWGEAVE